MTDALSREAVRFVNEASESHQPFFLYLAYNAPHTPLEARREDLAHYASIEDEKRRVYAGMIHAVDRGVGNLTRALLDSGELKNTLIVFLSDNGGKTSAGASNGPLAKGKGSVFEGGVRVPMLLHWPARISPGVRYDHPVSALDFYPTFAGLAGAKIPKDKVLDGTDFWEPFQAGLSCRDKSPLFAMRHRDGISDVSVRKNEWKVVRYGGPKQAWKLFNLSNDIGEQRDLSQMYPDRVQAMAREAKAWGLSHVEPMWFDNLNAKRKWENSRDTRFRQTFNALNDANN